MSPGKDCQRNNDFRRFPLLSNFASYDHHVIVMSFLKPFVLFYYRNLKIVRRLSAHCPADNLLEMTGSSLQTFRFEASLLAMTHSSFLSAASLFAFFSERL